MTALRRFLLVAAFAALLSLLLLALPRDTIQESASLTSGVEALDNSRGYSDPERFAAYHAAIRTAGDGSGYPQGSKMEAYARAIGVRKQPGRKLVWIERGPVNVPGRTRALIVDPDDSTNRTWYAGAVSGGLWKTTDAGASWQPLTDHLPNLAVSTLAMADSDRDVIYMGTGEDFNFFYWAQVPGSGIFKTRDRGRTWIQLAVTKNDEGFRRVNRLAVDPNDASVVVAATNAGIYRTVDGGDTWDRVYAYDGDPTYLRKGRVQDLRALPDDFSIQFATVHGEGVLRSTDAGVTWEASLNDFLIPIRRLELAVTPTSPEVVYVSADALDASLLYRSTDGGESWTAIVDTRGVGAAHWLTGQGSYDQTIGVHPFDVNKLFLGGIQLWEADISPGIREVKYLSDYEQINVGGFIQRFAPFWPQANYFGRRLLSGDVLAEVDNVTPDDFVSVEIRFGPTKAQRAHRFTVSRTYGTERGHGRSLAEYEYQDYVDVPFEVWDTDNDMQLMVSFRDQADDGAFELRPQNISGDHDSQSREYVFIHGYAYSEAGPDARIAQDGGLADKMLYLNWWTLPPNATWDSNTLPESLLRIEASAISALERETRMHLANEYVHVDHHSIYVMPIDENRNEFWILNANDGGVYLSQDGGRTFSGVGRGYSTTQFYGVAKRPGFDQYIAGAQDNGSWISAGDGNRHQDWSRVAGGDGFEAVWHAKDDRLILASSQANGVVRSTTGGDDWGPVGHDGPGSDSPPFVTVFGYSRETPDRVFMVGASGVWRSDDFGMEWKLTPILHATWGTFSDKKVAVAQANPNEIWAGASLQECPREINLNLLHVSTDGGDTFRPVRVPGFAPCAPISGLATHPGKDSTAYVLFSVFSQPKILRTTDLGQTWTDLSGFEGQSVVSTNGFPNVAVYDLLIMPHDEDIIWVGTDVGLFESQDGGQSWLYADNGLPAVSVWQMQVVDDQIVVATFGRGIWTIDLPSAVASTGFGPILGPDFVFFADGVNPRIKAHDGSIVMDPDGGGPNRHVLRFNSGSGAYRSVGFARNEGVNLTSNLARKDLLYIRLRISPQNRGLEGLSVVFEDKTDGNRRVDGTADLPFRASWRIPEGLRDGTWHDMSIPLPPETWEALEEARLSSRLTGLAANWHYDGAETPAGLRVARDSRGPDTAEHPELWREFEWTNVHALGISWDHGAGGGPVWLDYAYLGQPGLDLSHASQSAAAVTRVSIEQGEDGNVISWAGVPNAGGYHVYVSQNPIADVLADNVSLLQRVSAREEAFSALHQVEIPHHSFSPLEVHYAVSSLGSYGAENVDVSASTASVSFPNPTSTPVIVELTESEAAQLTSAIERGAVARAGFPEWMTPFRLDSGRSSPGDGGSVIQDDNDLSGTFWMAQSPENELFIYAEVQDDVVKLAGGSVHLGDSWQYDSFEIGLGNYDVRDIRGGSMLAGTPHRFLERGIHADYLFRVSAHGDGSRTYVYVGGSLNAAIPGGAATFDVLRNADGKEVGWRALAIIPLDAIQNAEAGDLVLDPVTGSDLRLVPLNIALNDADQTGVRDSQIQWSTKPNADGSWWHSPVQWPVVAAVGRATWTGVAGTSAELPVTFSLKQNFPNPFNPATTITFTLASDEPVTLTVFDALGRRVAVLLDRKKLTRGSHTVSFGAQGLASGVYFYQLMAGNAFLESKRMMLVK